MRATFNEIVDEVATAKITVTGLNTFLKRFNNGSTNREITF